MTQLARIIMKETLVDFSFRAYLLVVSNAFAVYCTPDKYMDPNTKLTKGILADVLLPRWIPCIIMTLLFFAALKYLAEKLENDVLVLVITAWPFLIISACFFALMP